MSDHSRVPIETNIVLEGLLGVLVFVLGRKGETPRQHGRPSGRRSSEPSCPISIDVEVLSLLTNQLVAGESSVRFSKQALCRALYGRPGGGGETAAPCPKALDPLTSTRLTFGGYVAERRANRKTDCLLGRAAPRRAHACVDDPRQPASAHLQPACSPNSTLATRRSSNGETLRALHGLAKRLFLYAAGQGPSDSWPRRQRAPALVLVGLAASQP